MKSSLVFAILAAMPLAACSTVLANQALHDAEKRCAADGKQFVQEKVEKGEYLVVSTATVSGHCAGPGEPGYVAPPAAH